MFNPFLDAVDSLIQKLRPHMGVGFVLSAVHEVLKDEAPAISLMRMPAEQAELPPGEIIRLAERYVDLKIPEDSDNWLVDAIYCGPFDTPEGTIQPAVVYAEDEHDKLTQDVLEYLLLGSIPVPPDQILLPN